MTGAFDDLIAANQDYSRSYEFSGMTGQAARGLAVVTCMDSRLVPLQALGLTAGDAKILRNAGARVTEDVLRTLVLAVYLLGVHRVLIMPHTDCRMAKATDEDIHELIGREYEVDTRSLEFHTVPDQDAALRRDIVRIRTYPYLPNGLAVGGAIYDVNSGKLMPVDL